MGSRVGPISERNNIDSFNQQGVEDRQVDLQHVYSDWIDSSFKNWNLSELGILACHKDGPCEVDSSRSRALPGLDADWNASQQANAEIISVKIEDWNLTCYSIPRVFVLVFSGRFEV